MRLRFYLVPLVAALLTACHDAGDVTAPLAATPRSAYADDLVEERRNLVLPINTGEYVSCAAGGEGEFVRLTGAFHFVEQVSRDGTGRVTVKWFANPAMVTGIGETTGLEYVGTGNNHLREIYFPGTELASSLDYSNALMLISKGGAEDLLLRLHIRFTRDADGTVLVERDTYELECR